MTDDRLVPLRGSPTKDGEIDPTIGSILAPPLPTLRLRPLGQLDAAQPRGRFISYTGPWAAVGAAMGQRNGNTGTEDRGPRAAVLRLLPVWLSADDACAELGVVPRTLRKYVARGIVERRREGRRSLYRIAKRIEARGAAIPQRPVPERGPGPQSTGPQSSLELAHRQVLELNVQLAEEVDDLNADNARLRAELEVMAATLRRSDRLVDLATQLVMRARH